MSFKEITDLIDISEENNLYSRELLTKELCRDEKKLIDFLISCDEIYFNYILNFLDDIILKLYSSDFVKKLKEEVFKRYNTFSNMNNYYVSFSECGD